MGDLTPGQRQRLNKLHEQLIKAKAAKAKPPPAPTPIKTIKYYLHRTIEIIRHAATCIKHYIKALLGL